MLYRGTTDKWEQRNNCGSRSEDNANRAQPPATAMAIKLDRVATRQCHVDVTESIRRDGGCTIVAKLNSFLPAHSCLQRQPVSLVLGARKVPRGTREAHSLVISALPASLNRFPASLGEHGGPKCRGRHRTYAPADGDDAPAGDDAENAGHRAGE